MKHFAIAFAFSGAATIGALACAAKAPIAHVDIVELPKPTSSASMETPTPVAVCSASRLACNKLGCMHVPVDWLGASSAEQRTACNAGHVDACTSLGARTALGEGVTYDATAAHDLLARACAAHDALGCVDVAFLDHATFDEWSKKCDAGIGEACLEAGNDIRFGKAAATHSPGDGARFYERACDHGVGNGCARLGYHYGTGLAVPRDDRHAYELMEHACNCDDDTGCSGVAYFLRDGHGVAKDTARAKRIFTKLCNRGVEASCVHLAVMYQKGEGVAVDLDRARTLYEAACNARTRDPEGGSGCVELGDMYRLGSSVTVDTQRAYTLYDQACQSQVSTGCGSLARFYRDGTIVQQDAARAKSLFDWACNHGDQESCTDRDAMP